MTLPNTQGMATLAGQAAHYAAVRARLFGSKVVDASSVTAQPEPSPASCSDDAASPESSPVRECRDVIDVATVAPLLRAPKPWKRIIEETCVAHQVSKAELLGSQRERRIVVARHEAMYRMKTETTLSLPQIGQRLGGKDHSSVHHGVRRHRERMNAL